MTSVLSIEARPELDDVPLPGLIDQLDAATDLAQRQQIIQALGRRRDPAVLSALLPLLDQDMRLRAAIIEAMGELRDRRAIPHLLSFLSDNTDALSEDNFAPRWRLADVAQVALQKIEDASSPKSAGTLDVNDDSNAAVAAARRSLWPFVPLGLAMLALPWAAVIIFAASLSSGEVAEADQAVHRLDAIAAAPAVIGLVMALGVAASKWPRGLIERFSLLIGGICCAAVTFSFGWEFLH
jgi:HEAT repeat protein